MARNLSLRNIYDKKFSSFPFTGTWQKAMGSPETCGIWLIYGLEKNGKTWFALMLANYLSTFKKVLYISAEEGLAMDFVAACKRAGLSDKNANIKLNEYLPWEDLKAKLAKRKGEKIIIIDNCTVYADELRGTIFHKLRQQFPDKLFIFLAHEEKKEPYTALGKQCKKFAKIIIHVKGLTASVSGRVPGGVITIDDNKAAIYWGAEILNK